MDIVAPTNTANTDTAFTDMLEVVHTDIVVEDVQNVNETMCLSEDLETDMAIVPFAIDESLEPNILASPLSPETEMATEILEKSSLKKKGGIKNIEDEIGVVSLSFHLDMLSATLNELRLNRPTPPPLIPLCRIYQNTAIRTVGSERLRLKRLYKTEGYIMEKGDFILSLTTSSNKQILVKDHKKTLWDPVWEKMSDDFDHQVSVNPHWADMVGCMFICWDGNHRLQGWMEAIYEDFSLDCSRHVSVHVSFIHPTPEGEMQLLSSMNRINKINEVGVVKSDLKDQLYSVRRLAECSPMYFAQRLTVVELKEVEKIRLAEAKKSNCTPWYPLTRFMLGKILFESDIEKDLEDARARYDSEKFPKTKSVKEVESTVYSKWANKMGKLLGIVNPCLGREWFDLVTKFDSSKLGFTFGLEKLHTLRCACVGNDIRNQWLEMSLGTLRAQFGIPNNDKEYRSWVAKETWFYHLLDQAERTLQECQRYEKFMLPADLYLKSYLSNMKSKYRKQLFFAIESDMDLSREGKDQPDITNSAKRLVWRYVKQAVDKNIIDRMPDIFTSWCLADSTGKSMYSEKYILKRDKGISEWEATNNPWWLDFPKGDCSLEEKELYELHLKGQLIVNAPVVSLPMGIVDVADALDSKLRERTTPEASRYAKRKHGRKIHLDRQSKNQDDSHPLPEMHVPHKRRREEYDYRPLPATLYNSSSKVHLIEGCILNIARGCMKRSISPELSQLIEKLKDCCLHGCTRKGKPVAYSADLMVLDFPTSFVPDSVGDYIPPWNECTDDLLEGALQLANTLLDDNGWVVCFMAIDLRVVFYRQLKRAGMTLRRIMVLRGIDRFGKTQDGVEVYSLDLYVLSRAENRRPLPTTDSANALDPSMFRSSLDTWIHYLPASERLYDASKTMQVRGGVQKSPLLMQYLVDTFCRPGGVVLDPMVGCGSTIQACRNIGRHCVAMDSDTLLMKRIVELYNKNPVATMNSAVAVDSDDDVENLDAWDVDDFES